jgi:hypothetical protein
LPTNHPAEHGIHFSVIVATAFHSKGELGPFFLFVETNASIEKGENHSRKRRCCKGYLASKKPQVCIRQQEAMPTGSRRYSPDLDESGRYIE